MSFAITVPEESLTYISDATIEPSDNYCATITITPVPFANTEGLAAENLPVLSVTITDAAGESATCDIPVTITQVNNVPEVLSSTMITVLPAELNALELERDIIVSVGGAGFETAQSIKPFTVDDVADIVKADILADTDSITCLDSVPGENPGESIVKVKIALNPEAKDHMAERATFKITFTDDGKEDQGDEYVGNKATAEFTVVLNPSPWFPFFELTCDCFDGVDPATVTHKVTITDADGKAAASLTVTGDTIYPCDYFGRTVGLLTGGVYTVTARNINATADCELTVATITTAYEAPEVPTILNEPNVEGTYDADGNTFDLKFEVPMASRYSIAVTDPDGATSKINGVFQPKDGDILIYSAAEENLKLAKAGEYTVTIQGFNPSYTEGTIISEPITVVVAQSGQVTTEWDYTKFLPATGTAQLTQDVVFFWSNYGTASAYTLKVLDSSNKEVKSVTVNDTTASVTLPYGNYCWYVLANGSNASDMLTLNIVNSASSLPLVKDVTFADNKVTFNCFKTADQQFKPGDVKIRIYYFTSSNTWLNTGIITPDYSEDGSESHLTLKVPGEFRFSNGDVILVQYYDRNDKKLNAAAPEVYQIWR